MVLAPSFVIGPMLAPVPTSTISLILGLVTGTSQFPPILFSSDGCPDSLIEHILKNQIPSVSVVEGANDVDIKVLPNAAHRTIVTVLVPPS